MADVRVYKVDDEGLVFGWANVAITADGETITDAHGDQIEKADLEAAAYDFVLKFGDTGVMHQGPSVGRLVESMMFTAEKAEALGVPAESLPVGWWVGFKIDDPDVFAKVKDGTYPMFSIQGLAEREEVDE